MGLLETGKRLRIVPGDSITFTFACFDEDGNAKALNTATALEACFKTADSMVTVTLAGGAITVLGSPNQHKATVALSAVNTANFSPTKTTGFDFKTVISGVTKFIPMKDCIEVIAKNC